jgi:hypothetical protein
MVCERPPAAFGGSPPREGETRAKRARGSLTHHFDLRERAASETHLNLQGDFAIVGRVIWRECTLQV